jgi:hypothetical protein
MHTRLIASVPSGDGRFECAQGGFSNHGGHPASQNGHPRAGGHADVHPPSGRADRRRAPPVASATTVGARPYASRAHREYGPTRGSVGCGLAHANAGVGAGVVEHPHRPFAISGSVVARGSLHAMARPGLEPVRTASPVTGMDASTADAWRDPDRGRHARRRARTGTAAARAAGFVAGEHRRCDPHGVEHAVHACRVDLGRLELLPRIDGSFEPKLRRHSGKPMPAAAAAR